MNGPEHYRKGEEWLAEAERWLRNSVDDLTVEGVRAAAELAQAHFLGVTAAASVPPSAYTVKLPRPVVVGDDEVPEDPPRNVLEIAGVVFEVHEDGALLRLNMPYDRPLPLRVDQIREIAAWLNAHADAADDTMPCGCSSGSCYCEPKAVR